MIKISLLFELNFFKYFLNELHILVKTYDLKL